MKKILQKDKLYIQQCIKDSLIILICAGPDNLDEFDKFVKISRSVALSKLSYLTVSLELSVNHAANVAIGNLLNGIYKNVNEVDLQCCNNDDFHSFQNFVSAFINGDNIMDENLDVRYSVIKKYFNQMLYLMSDKKMELKKSLESLNITYIDKYEDFLQKMINECNDVIELINNIEYMGDVVTMSYFIWRKYLNGDINNLYNFNCNDYQLIYDYILNFSKGCGERDCGTSNYPCV